MNLALLIALIVALSAGAGVWLFLKKERIKLDREIEKRRELEEKLFQSENRLKIIVESEPELVTLQDRNGRVLEMNPAGLALIDVVNSEDIIGEPIYSVIAPEDHFGYANLLNAVFRGEAQIMEFRVVSRQGKEHWLEMHAFPLRDGKNTVVALVGIARDITRRRQAEEAASKHQMELARVARLSLMGEMAAGIAHELNQPLSAISSYAQGTIRRLHADTISKAEVLETMEHIRYQVERAGQIIRHVRNFVRKREPAFSVVDLNAAVNEICTFLHSEVRQKCVAMHLSLAPQLPQVRANNIEIQQVIMNLTRNALDAMSTSSVSNRELVIKTALGSDRMVEVTVSDTGPGIPEQVVANIFDPFFTTKPTGMGMGLSISRSIIESHGGRLWLAANGSTGATFKFVVPVADGC